MTLHADLSSKSGSAVWPEFFLKRQSSAFEVLNGQQSRKRSFDAPHDKSEVEVMRLTLEKLSRSLADFALQA